MTNPADNDMLQEIATKRRFADDMQKAMKTRLVRQQIITSIGLMVYGILFVTVGFSVGAIALVIALTVLRVDDLVWCELWKQRAIAVLEEAINFGTAVTDALKPPPPEPWRNI